MESIHANYATNLTKLAFSVQYYKQLATLYRTRGQYGLMGLALEQARHLEAQMEEAHEIRHLIRR